MKDHFFDNRILSHSIRHCAPPENPGGLRVFAGKITCHETVRRATSAFRTIDPYVYGQSTFDISFAVEFVSVLRKSALKQTKKCLEMLHTTDLIKTRYNC